MLIDVTLSADDAAILAGRAAELASDPAVQRAYLGGAR
jgi:ABC-type branched-subunit amino acid transport system ATPase component